MQLIQTFSPIPKIQKDLSLELQRVQTRSQISTPCYTAKQDSIVNEDDNQSQFTPSPSHIDMEQPEPLAEHEFMVLKKDFKPDLVGL